MNNKNKSHCCLGKTLSFCDNKYVFVILKLEITATTASRLMNSQVRLNFSVLEGCVAGLENRSVVSSKMSLVMVLWEGWQTSQIWCLFYWFRCHISHLIYLRHTDRPRFFTKSCSWRKTRSCPLPSLLKSLSRKWDSYVLLGLEILKLTAFLSQESSW